MKGAIIGDIVGSVYEYNPVKTNDFKIFDTRHWFLKWFDPKDIKMRITDDTVLTIATMNAIINNISYEESTRDIGQNYANAGYGKLFFNWLFSENYQPYYRYGNGSAMRVSPVGWAFSTKAKTLEDLSSMIESAKVLPIYIFSVYNYQKNISQILKDIQRGKCQDDEIL